MDRYGRPLSPGSRRIHQPGRSSTGTIYSSSFDPYYGPTRTSREFTTVAGPRSSADRVVPSSRVVPKYKPSSPPLRQSREDFVVRPRRLTLDPEGPEIRRPLSVIDSSSPNRAKPIITTADRPASPLSKPGRLRPEEPHYLLPASSTKRHSRNYTIGSTDSGRLVTDGRDLRERSERGGYRSTGIGGGRSGYNLNQPLVRQPQGDQDRGGYEYTDRREQMYRDTEPKPRVRRDGYAGGRERPLSMTGLEDYAPRVQRADRETGPPVSTRGFGAIGRSGSLRQNTGARDYDPAPSDFSHDDYERRKANVPRVALHQDPGDRYIPRRDDEPYEDVRTKPRKTVFEDERPERAEHKSHELHEDRSRRHSKQPGDEGRAEVRPREYYRDGYDRNGDDRPRRHHDREYHRDYDRDEDRDWDRDRRRRDEPVKEKRDPQPRDKQYHGDHGLDNPVLMGGAAAVTALAAESARHHHHHPHHHKERDETDFRQDPNRGSRDRLAVGSLPTESTSTSTVSGDKDEEEERRERHRRKRERREREEREARELAERDHRRAPEEVAYFREQESRRGPEAFPPARDNAIHEQKSYERTSPNNNRRVPEIPNHQPRHHHHYSRTPDQDSYSDSSSSSDSSDDTRPRIIPVVTPASEFPPEPSAPKGILRKPKEKFPEDPAPVREGVAPLKDAGKKGIPPHARWTKIDRKLVNPDALKAGNERYEERADYVIVLRVLTKEEIEQYAAKTQEIRAQRGIGPMGEGGSQEERR
ncbi:MAG: hypothetical protein Q9190_007512 [Brigantiaea leucoxantha]